MKRFLFLIFLSNLFISLEAEDIPIAEIRRAADSWLLRHGAALYKAQHHPAAQSPRRLVDSCQTEMPLVFVPLEPQGYVILTTNTSLPPVIAFSDTATAVSIDAQSDFFALLESQGRIFEEILMQPRTRGDEDERAKYETAWSILLNDRAAPTRAYSQGCNEENLDKILVSPFLTSHWNQRYPYNLLSPSSRSGLNNQAASGCVPTALAQILYFHQWPPRGKGSKTYTDWNENNDAHNLFSTLRADFSRDYAWNLMQDSYPYGKTGFFPTYSEQAVGRFLHDVCVICEVDFEEDSTGAFLDNLPPLIAEHLYYKTPIYTNPRPNKREALYGKVMEDLKKGIPVLLGNPGHAFVAHGLAVSGGEHYCYMNYGWSGEYDGWFRFDSVYDYSAVNGAITNLLPQPVPLFRPMDTVQSATTTLSWDFPKTLSASAFRITAKPKQGKAVTVADDISGDQREYTLQGELFGDFSFQIAACVNGSWQSSSPPLQLTLTDQQPVPFESSVSITYVPISAGQVFNLTIAANKPLASVGISTTRPDIFPEGCSKVKLDGSRATVEIRSCFGRCGYALLWLDTISTDGCRFSHEIMVDVNRDSQSPYWCRNLAEASKYSSSPSSLILMVAGDLSQADVQELVFSHCERDDIKKLLLEKYVLWYADASPDFMADNPSWGDEWKHYTSNEKQNAAMPVVTIISPFVFKYVVARHEGAITADELYDLLNADYSDYISILGNTLTETLKPAGSNLDFKTGGDAKWFVSQNHYKSPPSSFQSGKISDSQATLLMAEVTGTGVLSFTWDVNSEYYDKLVFYLDGKQKSSCSGRYHTWETKTYELNTYGRHSFIWCYTKDNKITVEKDCGWVDNIVWTPNPTYLYGSSSNLRVPCSENEAFLDVFANIPWTASCDAEWISIRPESGAADARLSIDCAANESVYAREAVINLSDGNETAFTCKIVQDPMPPRVSISCNAITVDNNETAFPLEISANCPWTITSNTEWLGVSKQEGEGNGIITVECLDNPWCRQREGVLTIMASINNQKVTVSCTITQTAAPPVLVLESSSIEASYVEGELSLTLSAANGDWRVTCDSDWLTPVQTFGAGPDVLTFQHYFNESLSPRNCTITVCLFNDDSVEAMETCVVVQEAGWTESILMLKTGWNLLALPLQPTEEGLAVLLKLTPYILDNKAHSYIPAAILDRGTPCWIFSKTAQTVTWTSRKADDWTFPALPNHGWNLVGIAQDLQLPDNIMEAWEWNGGKFIRHASNTPLCSGHAYWIFCRPK